ncbi:MAG: MBL fold metallo-hydrolase [Bacteroidetes bacterium]|nr:MBL fold metallo-hydrolase [Bacteroidota bacterium]MDA1120935.1 MBL fold metallo-hydrolase [Bacteroidota bacterium]
MTITFLGTGTSHGIPVITCDCEVCRSIDYKDKRLRSSVLIETGDKNIVIDTGPDFRQQMLRERIQSLDAVLFTHQHKDHTAGLDDIRSFNFRDNSEMPIYATKEVLEQLKQEYAYVFRKDSYPGVPRVNSNSISIEPFTIGKTKVRPIQVWHHKLPVLGYRINDFTYITDANRIEKSELAKIKGSKVLVLNALRKTPHISHFSLDEAIEMAQKADVQMTYLTHFSHDIGKHRVVSHELPDNVRLAYDGLKISL